jgi:hypothetical protein
LATGIPQFGQLLGISFSRHYGAQHRHSRGSLERLHGGVDANVHLIQTLLHPAQQIRLLAYQNRLLPDHPPHLADLLAGTIYPLQQSVTRQRLQPLAVLRIRLSPRYARERTRVHQHYLPSAALHDFQHRNPVHPRAFHRH